MNLWDEIAEKYGQEYILRQLAEECAELTQAALKVIRASRKETPMREDEAMERFMEELADVNVMMNAAYRTVLSADQRWAIAEIETQKTMRTQKRMLDGKMEEDVW